MGRFGKVGVLAGGPSSERAISLRSGEAVCSTLKTNGIDAMLLDLRADIETPIKDSGIDVAFIALHGGFGEDGTLQAALEALGIPYTGSGPEASRLAMDKAASREIFKRSGITVPRYKIYAKNEAITCDGLRMPLVFKPQREGSSVGLSVASAPQEIYGACRKAFKYGDTILVEEFIKGRELTVGILGDEPLPVVEIVTERRCYDYDAKYKSGKTKYLVPAPIDSAISRKAQAVAKIAHDALGCAHFSRTDMILSEKGGLFVLEVNTIPGMTRRSLLPKAACAAGIDFYRLCKSILEGTIR